MLIETTVPLNIGDQVPVFKFEVGVSHSIPGVVTRLATEEEYVNDCLADPELPEDSRHLMVVTGDSNKFWYEVSVD